MFLAFIQHIPFCNSKTSEACVTHGSATSTYLVNFLCGQDRDMKFARVECFQAARGNTELKVRPADFNMSL